MGGISRLVFRILSGRYPEYQAAGIPEYFRKVSGIPFRRSPMRFGGPGPVQQSERSVLLTVECGRAASRLAWRRCVVAGGRRRIGDWRRGISHHRRGSVDDRWRQIGGVDHAGDGGAHAQADRRTGHGAGERPRTRIESGTAMPAVPMVPPGISRPWRGQRDEQQQSGAGRRAARPKRSAPLRSNNPGPKPKVSVSRAGPRPSTSPESAPGWARSALKGAAVVPAVRPLGGVRPTAEEGDQRVALRRRDIEGGEIDVALLRRQDAGLVAAAERHPLGGGRGRGVGPRAMAHDGAGEPGGRGEQGAAGGEGAAAVAGGHRASTSVFMSSST